MRIAPIILDSSLIISAVNNRIFEVITMVLTKLLNLGVNQGLSASYVTSHDIHINSL